MRYGDLSNLQWANRLGRDVIIRTDTEVVAGRVDAIGKVSILVGKKSIKRSDIKRVEETKK